MKIIIPDYVNTLLKKLEENHFEAFIVGGSVRDSLLGKVPSDYDITTDALPEEIEDTFQEFRTVGIGKEFGTIIVIQDRGNVEITTYRIEKEYIDGRRPSQVDFSNNIVEDLKRRDFTINAIAYSEKQGIVDPFDGRSDLKNKIIKTVGNPKERFFEDHLRILRCIRFSTSLHFKIEEDTLRAAKKMGYLLKKISAERIRDELFKILLSKKPSKGIRLLNSLEILKIIIPEFTESVFNEEYSYRGMEIFDYILCVVDNTPPIIEIRLAALLHPIGQENSFRSDVKVKEDFYAYENRSASLAESILKRFNTSGKIVKTVKILIKNHSISHNKYSKKALKSLINNVGKERVFYLLDLQIASMECTNKNTSFLRLRKNEIRRIIDENEPLAKKQLAIDGSHIVKLGYIEGRIIGEILEYLLELVLEDPKLNDKETLTKIILNEFKMK